MARTPLSVQQTSVAGLNLSMSVANADGHSIPGSADVVVVVENASDSAVTVTIPTPATIGGLAIADGGGSVPAGEARHFGPFRAGLFNQADATVSINLSAAASVSVAAFRLGHL